MIGISDKTNGNQVEAYQYNSVKDNVIDLVTSSGQTLVTDAGSGTVDTNEEQISIAAAIYAAGGNYYVESGVANAYVLETQTIAGANAMNAPNAYFNGMSCRFIAGNTNTATSTVNVSGLGIKTIRKNNGTEVLVAGDIITNYVYEIIYKVSTGFFELIMLSSLYERGIWTPVLAGSGGTSGQTYSDQTGQYIKIGKLVTCTFYLRLTTKGTITNSVQIEGLPFVAGTLHAGLAIGYNGGIILTAGHILTGRLATGTQYILLGETNYQDDTPVNLVTANLGTTPALSGTISFIKL